MAERYSNPVVDDSLIDWVIKEEGFLSKPTDIGDGKVTIGSGLTDPKWIEKYKKKGYWSKEDNRKAVAEELQKRSNWAEDTLPNWSTLPINAKRAMLSYKYNYDFTRENSPKLFGAMENGNFVEAIRQMDATSKNPKFKKGLQARREREQQWGLEGLFDKPSLDSRYEYPDATTFFNPYTAKVQNITFTDQAVPTNPSDNLIEAEKVSAEINEYDKVKRAIDTQASFRRLMQGNAWENQSEPEKFVPQGINYVIGYSDGGKLDKKKKWDDLSITEKSEMIDVAIRNGIVDLPTIKQKYNEFAIGGDTDVNTGPYIVSPVTTSHTPLDTVRKRLYENVTPFGYENPISRVFNAVVKNEQDRSRWGENVLIESKDPQASTLDAIWATYLNIPEEDRRKIDSNYGITKTPEGYYKLNNPDMAFDFDYNLSDKGPYHNPSRVIRMNGILGNYTIGRDRDDRGDYIYYSDSFLDNNNTPDIKTGWDINPYSNTADNITDETTEERGIYGQDRKGITYNIGKTLFGNVEDISMGIGTPVPIYDKIYLDDYYDIPEEERGAHYLPEITIRTNKKALGGHIYDGLMKDS